MTMQAVRAPGTPFFAPPGVERTALPGGGWLLRSRDPLAPCALRVTDATESTDVLAVTATAPGRRPPTRPAWNGTSELAPSRAYARPGVALEMPAASGASKVPFWAASFWRSSNSSPYDTRRSRRG